MIIIQLIALLFGFAGGQHDVPAVDNFTNHGSTPQHQAKFHWWNWIMKACFVGAVAYYDNILLAISCGILIWVIFDPVIAIFRTVYVPPKKPWYYLSTGNRTDRLLLKLLGPKAGIWKFAIGILTVLILNYVIITTDSYQIW